jgi:anti-sigma factor RsiW
MMRLMMWLVGRGDEATCREAGRGLQSWLDGELDPAAARRIDKHLQACRRCGLEADTYRRIRTALEQRSPAPDPVAVARLTAFTLGLARDDDGGR